MKNIIAAKTDRLVIGAKTNDAGGRSRFETVELRGTWRLDQYNQIYFAVRGKNQKISGLKGTWKINDNQQVAYTYGPANTIVFEGHWQIDKANQLSYIFGADDKNRFDFRAQVESPNLYPQSKAIKYRLGIGARDKKYKIISLYGDWKFGRNLGVSFVMDCGQGRFQELSFGAEVRLDKQNQISFSLLNKRNQPLGLTLTFTHSFLKKLDAQAFLRLKSKAKELGIEAGVRIPF